MIYQIDGGLMWDSRTSISIPRSVEANLKLILGDSYNSFLYQSLLSYKDALTAKINKLRDKKNLDKYYTTFSKSYNVPNTNLKLKFQTTISCRDYSRSRPQEDYAFDPRATHIKILIPILQGTDSYRFDDLMEEAVAHAFDKEVLGVNR
jgi:hypothetical protein